MKIYRQFWAFFSYLLLHYSKYLWDMSMKLSETIEEVHVSAYFKFQTSISFFLVSHMISKLGSGHESWDPNFGILLLTGNRRWRSEILNIQEHITPSIVSGCFIRIAQIYFELESSKNEKIARNCGTLHGCALWNYFGISGKYTPLPWFYCIENKAKITVR